MEVDILQDEEGSEGRQDRSNSVSDTMALERAQEGSQTTTRGKRGRFRTAGQSGERKSRAKSARQKMSLSLLPTMPLDILFEVFGYLEIRDVINLSRTSRIFRDTLFSPSATLVWKNIRRHFDAPDPLGGVSEAGWTELLFGNTCQDCGARNVLKADFFIRRRLCKACKERSLIDESTLKEVFDIPKYMSILDFVPSTRGRIILSVSFSFASLMSKLVNKEDEHRYFYSPEVEVIVKKLNAFHRDMRADTTAAIQSYYAFREERKQLVLTVLKGGKRCAKWQNQYIALLQVNKDQIIAQRRDAIFERLRQLGYADEDVQRQSDAPEVNQPKLLTERIWQKIRPILERNIHEDIEERKEAALAEVVDSRRRIVDALYLELRRMLRPHFWKLFPRTEEVFHFKPIRDLIEAPLHFIITVQHFAQAMINLPTFLDLLSEAKCWKCLQLLHESLPGNAAIVPGQIPFEVVMQKLGMATAVFECRQTRNTHRHPFVIIGLDELLTHHCDAEDASDTSCKRFIYRPSTRTLSFSSKGAETARTLIRMTGLDPATAYAVEMDQKDMRFVCHKDAVNWSQYSPEIGYFVAQVVYAWREAIEHELACLHGCEWEMLSQADADQIKIQERNDAKWTRPKWTCSHCTDFMNNLDTRQTVCDHVQTAHGIQDPQEPRDLFFLERFRTSFSASICHAVPAPTEDQPLK